MRTVRKVIENQHENHSLMDWKVVLTECGMWAWTTSKFVDVGDDVEIEYRNEMYKWYVSKNTLARLQAEKKGEK